MKNSKNIIALLTILAPFSVIASEITSDYQESYSDTQEVPSWENESTPEEMEETSTSEDMVEVD